MRALPLLAVLALPAFAEDPQPDPVTRHIPADAFLAVRFAAPERLDGIGADLPALAAIMETRRPLGDVILRAVATTAPVDRSKPFYWALGPGGPVILFAAPSGTTAEEIDALNRGGGAPRYRLLPDGWVRAAGKEVPDGDADPLPMLSGDLSLVVPAARLVDRNRGKIDEALGKIDDLGKEARRAGAPVPPGATKLLSLLMAKVVRAAADVTDVTYALTWRGGKLESEGWVRTREGSPLRKWIEARGGAKPAGLVELLPASTFWTIESGGTTAALDADISSLLDEALGEGAGDSLLLLLSPSYALHDHLTGQAAGAITVEGAMAMRMVSIHEMKPGVKIDEAIGAIDTEKANRLLAELGIPLEMRLERGVAKSGETAIHRLAFTSLNPQVAMFGLQMQTCFAVEGGYLLVAQSASPENVLRSLLLRVRSGERAGHEHGKAMERLMADRQEGLSVNVGALKPILGLAALAIPEAAQVVNAFPDELLFSTALAVRGGSIRIRGDWPLKECVEFASTLQKTLR